MNEQTEIISETQTAEIVGDSTWPFYEHYPTVIPILFMVVFVGAFYWFKRKN